MRAEPSATPAPVRLLAVADTDSYLKWSAATLDALPNTWKSSQVLIQNPVLPSQAQIRAASSRPVDVLSYTALVRRIRHECPDVVLLACTGPVVASVTAHRVLWGPNRPVLVTGLPGISVPATQRAVLARAACDLFLLHSKREVAEFADIGRSQAPRLRFALAHLPFLPVHTSENVGASNEAHDLLFAAQAKVPIGRRERQEILLALADTGSAAVKLRAYAEEQQTHRETWCYPEIMHDLVARGRVAPDAVAFVAGSMRDALLTARGFVTVSSTAALEAIAMGRQILIISDFGVSAEMINLVFEESGCLGTLDDLRSGRLFQPDQRWLDANYFHPVEENDWLEQLTELLTVRATGQLPGRPRLRVSASKRLRRRLRLLIPSRLVQHLRRLQRESPRPRARTSPPLHPEVLLPSVLFVCVHNAGRSQMAAGYLAKLSRGRIEARSAGSEPADKINPVAIQAMAEEGIDIATEQPKVLTSEVVQASDVVVTMGCGDACHYYSGKRYEDWNCDDPAGQDIDHVRKIRDQIREGVESLISELLS